MKLDGMVTENAKFEWLGAQATRSDVRVWAFVVAVAIHIGLAMELSVQDTSHVEMLSAPSSLSMHVFQLPSSVSETNDSVEPDVQAMPEPVNQDVEVSEVISPDAYDPIEAVEVIEPDAEIAQQSEPVAEQQNDRQALDEDSPNLDVDADLVPTVLNDTVEPEQDSGLHNEIVTEPSFRTPPQPPVYPRLAQRRGQEGVVWLEIQLDEFGRQLNTIILTSSGVDSLDLAALTAVAQWQFEGRQRGDSRVPSRVQIPINFSLQ
ncbi:energy transducer TonB [Echinimonas agarilytica]|uniref:TonB family protein n=1 Tax=Echinimonas agarilytica TaxID=1215918 RepID=A0AA42B7R6_9GAMM|nr:energy transducer TonB [Echinimonas agarilytica]MCM2679598.1 TonB family protein [Echinimonas agarilytica]